MKSPSWPRRYWSSFSFVGLIFSACFFAASLSPSLLPRMYIVQGVLCGVALAIGYAAGVLTKWLWHYLELPVPKGRIEQRLKRLATIGSAILCCSFLWRAATWQNSIRELMEMKPVESAYPVHVALIAILTAAMVIAGARIFWRSCKFINSKMDRVIPRRISILLSIIIVGTLSISIVNGVFARYALRAADAAFREIDAVVDEEIPQPADSLASGSADSLVPWDTIGRQGKNFIVDGPTKEELGRFTGSKTPQPIRVYVGLRSAESPHARARLALDELKRVGGFERSVLVVATPTGTGWLDPSAVDTLEFLHAGDTAIVSMQYSYLPSWITIAIDPNRSRESGHILFDEIYDYWTTLPADKRPRLYLHGLSLGSLGSEESADLLTIFEDPIHGAVWSGPPFPSTQWAHITKNRKEGSPAWLPEFRDSAMVRFTAQQNSLNTGKRWGPVRNVYIQYASDPMIFFSQDLVFRKPDWLKGGRGPDVSPYLTWYPIVTALQIGFDLPMATAVPLGYGHNYSPSSYIDAWVAVTTPADWTEQDTHRLKSLFAKRLPPTILSSDSSTAADSERP